MLVKLDHFPKDRGEHKKYLKPPPSYIYQPKLCILKSTSPKITIYGLHYFIPPICVPSNDPCQNGTPKIKRIDVQKNESC